MAQFEVAQIANLCCEDAEEAKALIPRYCLLLLLLLFPLVRFFIKLGPYYSLENKVEVPELQEMLSQMLTIKKFQG